MEAWSCASSSSPTTWTLSSHQHPTVEIRKLRRQTHNLFISNANLAVALDECCDPEAIRLEQHLIGRNPDGSYRASKAKEYPPLLNRAFATAIFAAMKHWPLAAGRTDNDEFGRNLALLAVSTEYDSMCPSCQPR